MTAFHLASLQGSTEIAEVLLENGADVEKEDDKGRRAIHFAVKGRNMDVLHLLIACQVNLNARTKGKLQTALQVAIDLEFTEGVQELIKHGCDVNLQDSDGDTPLHNAAFRKKSLRKGGSIRSPVIISDAILRSKRADLSIRNKLGWTVLHAAIISNSWRLTWFLLEQESIRDGLALATISGTSTTPFHLVCSKGHFDMIGLLDTAIKKEMLGPHRKVHETVASLTNQTSRHIFERDDTGKSPLLLACTNFCDYTLFEALVMMGSDVNATDKNGDTTIILIAKKLRASGKIILLKVATSVIHKIYREYRGHAYKETMEKYPELAAICFLIAKGGSLEVVNKAGESAMDIMDDPAVTRFLKDFAQNPRVPVVAVSSPNRSVGTVP